MTALECSSCAVSMIPPGRALTCCGLESFAERMASSNESVSCQIILGYFFFNVVSNCNSAFGERTSSSKHQNVFPQKKS